MENYIDLIIFYLSAKYYFYNPMNGIQKNFDWNDLSKSFKILYIRERFMCF